MITGKWKCIYVTLAAIMISAFYVYSQMLGGPNYQTDHEKCLDMAIQHNVIVGETWGTLPESLQLQWTLMSCDSYHKDAEFGEQELDAEFGEQGLQIQERAEFGEQESDAKFGEQE